MIQSFAYWVLGVRGGANSRLRVDLVERMLLNFVHSLYSNSLQNGYGGCSSVVRFKPHQSKGIHKPSWCFTALITLIGFGLLKR
jgi:hypothetical protein